MADRRIRTDSDMTAFVDELSDEHDNESCFRLRADVLAFAASLGFSRNKRIRINKSDSSPIRYGVFVTHGYDPLIKLLAVCSTDDPTVLGNSEAAEDTRATIFEEYANGGLSLLKETLSGVVDAREQLLRILQCMSTVRAEKSSEASPGEFDITSLIV